MASETSSFLPIKTETSSHALPMFQLLREFTIPHVPYVGDSVRLVRSCSNFGPDQVQENRQTATKVVLPAWMLDEDTCRVMAIREQPLIAVQVLLRLRTLLTANPFLLVATRQLLRYRPPKEVQLSPPKTTVVPVRRKRQELPRRGPTTLS